MVRWELFHNDNDAQKGGQGVVMVMLSLNLIVLAFFILLNALAKPVEERMAAALYSVQEGFDYREIGGMLGSDATALDGPVWVPRVAEDVRGEVLNKLPHLADRLEVAADEIRLAIPAADAWEATELKPAAQALLANLMALQGPNEGDVTLHVRLMGGEAGLRAPRIAALVALLEGVAGWDVEGDGGLLIRLKARGPGVPEFARRAERTAKQQGSVIETVGEGSGGE